jgi:Uncharacterized conserved protein
MKIVLAGVETNNKGAELMFYAILQEIERKFPDAIVYVEPNSVTQGLEYLKTTITLKEKPIAKVIKLCNKINFYWIAKRLRVPTIFFEDIYAISKADFYLDGSGFHFSDQWDYPESYLIRKQRLWSTTSKQGTKIVFLPQAFGPFEKNKSRKYLEYMAQSADLIMPREQQSFKYLEDTGIVNMEKVKLFPDFTSLVEGIVPERYAHLKGAVCVIPNYNMIESGTIEFEDYIVLLTSIMEHAYDKGKTVFLLNHEGEKDEELAYKCQKKIGRSFEVVTGLNALEVKGLISVSYLVISSRFHGVVSSLNSCVPCLATSWSHKYEELYKDYKVQNGVLPINNLNDTISSIDKLLIKEHNDSMRIHLVKQQSLLQQKARDMWVEVWKNN